MSAAEWDKDTDYPSPRSPIPRTIIFRPAWVYTSILPDERSWSGPAGYDFDDIVPRDAMEGSSMHCAGPSNWLCWNNSVVPYAANIALIFNETANTLIAYQHITLHGRLIVVHSSSLKFCYDYFFCCLNTTLLYIYSSLESAMERMECNQGLWLIRQKVTLILTSRLTFINPTPLDLVFLDPIFVNPTFLNPTFQSQLWRSVPFSVGE